MTHRWLRRLLGIRSPSRDDLEAGRRIATDLLPIFRAAMAACPCGGDRIGGSGCTCDPSFGVPS